MGPSTEKPVCFPLHAWSVVIAFFADWLLFATNLSTDLHMMPLSVVVAALFAGVATALIERWLSAASWPAATVKALMLAILVAAPLPLLGTVLGVAGALWAITVALSRPTPTRHTESARGQHALGGRT
jgi:hypothetical protein